MERVPSDVWPNTDMHPCTLHAHRTRTHTHTHVHTRTRTHVHSNRPLINHPKKKRHPNAEDITLQQFLTAGEPVVVANYYCSCRGGRRESQLFVAAAKELRATFAEAGTPVDFVMDRWTLKKDVDAGTACSSGWQSTCSSCDAAEAEYWWNKSM